MEYFGPISGVLGLGLGQFGPILVVPGPNLGHIGPVLGVLVLDLGHFQLFVRSGPLSLVPLGVLYPW